MSNAKERWELRMRPSDYEEAQKYTREKLGSSLTDLIGIPVIVTRDVPKDTALLLQWVEDDEDE